MISDEDYKLLDRRYRRKLRDIIAQNQVKRENTHTPVLALEQHKESKMLEEKDRIFKGILDQWGIHEDPKWRLKVVAEAERFQDKLESARRILELQGQSETVTVPPTVTVESSAYSPENSHVEGAVPAQEPGDQTT
jgi:hypothetical protein